MLSRPFFVELEVTETDPGFAGNTATNATKPATLETGAEIKRSRCSLTSARRSRSIPAPASISAARKRHNKKIKGRLKRVSPGLSEA